MEAGDETHGSLSTGEEDRRPRSVSQLLDRHRGVEEQDEDERTVARAESGGEEPHHQGSETGELDNTSGARSASGARSGSPPASEVFAPASPHASAASSSSALAGSAATEEDDALAEVTMVNREVMAAYRDLTSIPETLAERYGSLATRLDLSHNCLSHLSQLERFTQLRELVLDHNDLSERVSFPSLPLLHSLSLNKNKISELDVFLSMAREKLESLAFLSLIGNEACPSEMLGGRSEEDYNRYRLRVLHVLPKLKFLDSRAVTQEEVSEARRVGQFARVVRVSESEVEGVSVGKREEEKLFSPLAKEQREGPKATIGTCKYVYYGRHSEGNRFIRNNDL